MSATEALGDGNGMPNSIAARLGSLQREGPGKASMEPFAQWHVEMRPEQQVCRGRLHSQAARLQASLRCPAMPAAWLQADARLDLDLAHEQHPPEQRRLRVKRPSQHIQLLIRPSCKGRQLCRGLRACLRQRRVPLRRARQQPQLLQRQPAALWGCCGCCLLDAKLRDGRAEPLLRRRHAEGARQAVQRRAARVLHGQPLQQTGGRTTR